MWGYVLSLYVSFKTRDSKVHGDTMGPIWGRQDPGGPHVGPMNFAICVVINTSPGDCPALLDLLIAANIAWPWWDPQHMRIC